MTQDARSLVDVSVAVDVRFAVNVDQEISEADLGLGLALVSASILASYTAKGSS